MYTLSLFPQSDPDISGYWPASSKGLRVISSNEFLAVPGNNIEDIGFGVSFGSEFAPQTSSLLYAITLQKRFDSHFFSLRYTPGYQRDFLFEQEDYTFGDDSTDVTSETSLSYKKYFDFTYTIMPLRGLYAGITLNYYHQSVDANLLGVVFRTDSLYLVRTSASENSEKINFDAGICYSINNNWEFSTSVKNIFSLSRSNFSDDYNIYDLRMQRKFSFSLRYSIETFSPFLSYITQQEYFAGFTFLLPLQWMRAGISVSAFKNQDGNGIFSGIYPSLAINWQKFGVSFSWMYYFQKRDEKTFNLSEFQQNGITGFINNKYSYNKAFLSVNYFLNTTPQQKLKFIDVTVNEQLYPLKSEYYLSHPIASATVTNITGSLVVARPSIKIEGQQTEEIFSPSVEIQPHDTVVIPYYILLPDTIKKQKADIAYATFYLNSGGENYDDVIQKPILINGINSWDGNVASLRFYVKKDFDFSQMIAKQTLSEYKNILDTIPAVKRNFYRIKILFDHLNQRLVYASDRRASADWVQFPSETHQLKGGDCDDLSVYFASLLESIGIDCSFVDYKPSSGIGHVNLLINTGLSPDEAHFITNNDAKYFIRTNPIGEASVWIPVEVTVLKSFEESWNSGADTFNDIAIDKAGLAKGTVIIEDIY